MFIEDRSMLVLLVFKLESFKSGKLTARLFVVVVVVVVAAAAAADEDDNDALPFAAPFICDDEDVSGDAF